MTQMIEPPTGSVVLAYGLEGTAYQRHYADGLWHGTNGSVRTWQELQDATMTRGPQGSWYPRLTLIHSPLEVA